MINILIDKNIEKQNSFEAIKYEHLLQNISYNPIRLSRLSKVLTKEYSIEFSNNINFVENEYKETLSIDLNTYKIEPLLSKDDKWEIDIKNIK